MAIKFVSVKCPECGADLDVEEGRQQIFCSYCGTKVMIQNDNEYIFRHIDEAEVEQAETERLIRLKKMEMAEQKRIEDEKTKAFKIKVSIVLAIIAALTLGIGFTIEGSFGIAIVGEVACCALLVMWSGRNKENDDDDFDYDDKVKVPSGISDYEEKSYSAIKSMFVSAGFTNVKCIPLEDLTVGILKKSGTVESITIRGEHVSSGGKKYHPDAPVVITYHSYR